MSLGIGLIGCGDIGSLRAQAVKRADSLRLVAVNDLDQERAKSITSKYGGVIEPDWLSLLRREDMNAVIISTPPSKHAEMCIEALKAGVLKKVQTPDELFEFWNDLSVTDENPMIRDFLSQHGGATNRAVGHLRDARLLG